MRLILSEIRLILSEIVYGFRILIRKLKSSRLNKRSKRESPDECPGKRKSGEARRIEAE